MMSSDPRRAEVSCSRSPAGVGPRRTSRTAPSSDRGWRSVPRGFTGGVAAPGLPSRHCRPYRGALGLLTLPVFVLLLLPAVCEALRCEFCDISTCRDPGECPVGVMLDTCRCCPTCARGLNDTCGGQFDQEGLCGPDLRCVVTPTPGLPISPYEVGVCQPIEQEAPAVPSALKSCDRAKCNIVFEPTCEHGSRPAPAKPQADECCPPTLICQCEPCPTEPVTCLETEVKVLQEKGTGQPGACCDIFNCIAKDEHCSSVFCDASLGEDRYDAVEGSGEVTPFVCPPDSQLLPPVETKEGCCRQYQGCKCRDPDSCTTPDCEMEGMHLQVVSAATRLPGSCCDQLVCINDTSKECIYNGVAYANAETWQPDLCTVCSCQEGVAFCSAVSCPSLGDCSWVSISEGECCPVCNGCSLVGGGQYANNETWMEDECIVCRCDAGHVQCQAQSCAIKCAHPRKIFGRCCPVCDDDTGATLPTHCDLLSNCTLQCSKGLQVDENDCYICQCVEEVAEEQEECSLDCPHGLVRPNDSSQPICQCADEPPTSGCPSMDKCDKTCIYGYKTKNGCDRCRCNKCPPFNCKKKCLDGYMYNQRGCKLCKCQEPFDEKIVTTTLAPFAPAGSCLSVDGRRMEDGESWYDGCRSCFCHDSQEMCSMITCPMPQCHNPVIRKGECCPMCGDDAIPLTPGMATRCHGAIGDGRTEGETWDLDECTRCICHAGGVLCEIESCPPILCHHPIRLPKTCCATCPNGSDLSPIPSLESQRVCRTSGGTKYSSGDSWRVNACQSCLCQAGQIHCFSQTCPLLTCERTILKKGRCCPYCLSSSAEPVIPGTNRPSRGPPYDDTRQENNSLGWPSPHEPNTHITTNVLVVVILFLCTTIIILIILLLRTRRKTYYSPHLEGIPHHLIKGGDASRVRPKSTNVELQGSSPLPAEGLKLINCQPVSTQAPDKHHELNSMPSTEETMLSDENVLACKDTQKYMDDMKLLEVTVDETEKYMNEIEKLCEVATDENKRNENKMAIQDEMMKSLLDMPQIDPNNFRKSV